MSAAIVCGKRSFFEDIELPGSPPSSAVPPPYKKFRCSSSTSPVRFNYSLPFQQSAIDQLVALFPDMEAQLLQKVLVESNNDLEAAIKCLQGLRISYPTCNAGSAVEETASVEQGAMPAGVDVSSAKDPQVQNNLPSHGSEWVDLFVKEMNNATSIDDAKSRAASILENLEKSISSRVGAEAAQIYSKENVMLREQIEALLKDNAILKRAVAIQHERQKEFEEKNIEVQQLRQLVSQYQEQMRNLELSNYALNMHLRQAQQNSTLPGRFHPDVF